jgi:Holliday junction resolvase RusA-like endonuclease
MNKLIIKIPMQTPPKKNSQQIMINSKTHRPFIRQSERYLKFERDCAIFLKKYKSNIIYPINLKCTFYVKDKRKRDLVNLLNAIQDVLVKYEILADDNYDIVQSVDGSRIIYEKGREETIIEIERSELNEELCNI